MDFPQLKGQETYVTLTSHSNMHLSSRYVTSRIQPFDDFDMFPDPCMLWNIRQRHAL